MNIINSILCDKRLIVGENIILKKIYVLYFKIGTRIFLVKEYGEIKYVRMVVISWDEYVGKKIVILWNKIWMI